MCLTECDLELLSTIPLSECHKKKQSNVRLADQSHNVHNAELIRDNYLEWQYKREVHTPMCSSLY